MPLRSHEMRSAAACAALVLLALAGRAGAEEAAAITEPGREFEIVATGVLVESAG